MIFYKKETEKNELVTRPGWSQTHIRRRPPLQQLGCGGLPHTLHLLLLLQLIQLPPPAPLTTRLLFKVDSLFAFSIGSRKQNGVSLLTPVSDSVFIALSDGTFLFSLHGSFKNHQHKDL